jgi:hypothetical protein
MAAFGILLARAPTARNTPMAQLFEHERCPAAILEFLATMNARVLKWP